MANSERGEFAITLSGIEYGMRPTFDAIQAFEGADGLQLNQLAEVAARGGLSVRACSVIVAECVRAWGKAEGNTSARAFQADAVGPMLLSQGIRDVQAVLAEMLFLAATGGMTPEGKRKATPRSREKARGAISAGSPARRSAGRRGNSGTTPR